MDANLISQFLAAAARKWTWLPLVMGLARLGAKWFSGPLQEKLTAMMVGAATGPDQVQAADWEHVLSCRPYRALGFTLDLVLSVKLPTLTDFLRARDQAMKAAVAQIPNTQETKVS